MPVFHDLPDAEIDLRQGEKSLTGFNQLACRVHDALPVEARDEPKVERLPIALSVGWRFF
jgi:hypothetical protein